MLPMPGLDGPFPKKGKGSVFVVRDEALIFSEDLGFNLPSLLANPALIAGSLIVCTAMNFKSN